jgi:hypothetical protein
MEHSIREAIKEMAEIIIEYFPDEEGRVRATSNIETIDDNDK